MIVLCIVAILVLYFLIQKNNKTNIVPNPKGQQSDFSQSYQRKYLFSLNEKHEFRKLVAWATAHDYFVFPKVRLLDIIEPRSNVANYKALLWKIQAKHVDFLICDQEMRIKFIIELDDNSHDRKDRAERDEFVAQALSGCGYTVTHTRGISEDFLCKLAGQDRAKGENVDQKPGTSVEGNA